MSENRHLYWLVPYFTIGLVILYLALGFRQINTLFGIDVPETFISIFLLGYGVIILKRRNAVLKEVSVYSRTSISDAFSLIIITYSGFGAILILATSLSLPNHPIITFADFMIFPFSLSEVAEVAEQSNNQYIVGTIILFSGIFGIRFGYEIDKQLWKIVQILSPSDVDPDVEKIDILKRYNKWRKDHWE